MYTPPGPVSCWFVTEDEYEHAQKNNRPYGEYYTTAFAYFLLMNRIDAITLEGYIGRNDRQEEYHSQILRGYTYFDDYNDRKKVYVTFDKANLYEITTIYPSKPLLFTLKLVPPHKNNTPLIETTKLNPQVFISYSWDDEEHKEWIIQLANKLSSKGIHVILDRFF